MVKKMTAKKIKPKMIVKSDKYIESTLKDINKTMKLSKAIIKEDIKLLKTLSKY